MLSCAPVATIYLGYAVCTIIGAFIGFAIAEFYFDGD